MIAFEVKDMTCGHCVSTITKALKAADRDAQVQIDLARHLVKVEPATADAQENTNERRGLKIGRYAMDHISIANDVDIVDVTATDSLKVEGCVATGCDRSALCRIPECEEEMGPVPGQRSGPAVVDGAP